MAFDNMHTHVSSDHIEAWARRLDGFLWGPSEGLPPAWEKHLLEQVELPEESVRAYQARQRALGLESIWAQSSGTPKPRF